MNRIALHALAYAAMAFTAREAVAQGDPRSSDPVFRAMRDELARSMESLRLDTLQKPYFVAYRITESERYNVGARLGSLIGGGDFGRQRSAQVEVRVGDYTFDNSNFMGGASMFGFAGFNSIPVDDDYTEVRRQLWLATDRAYKQAIEALSQKRAALDMRTVSDSAPDFSRHPPHTDFDGTSPPPVNRAEADALVRAMSAVFKTTPDIQSSSVSLSAGWSLVRYVNSEGTAYTRMSPRASVSVTAATQAEDGMPIADGYAASAPTQALLPGRDSLLKAVHAMASGLVALRTAKLAEPYDGPVLFEGEAAAELFANIIAPKLVGTRRPLANVQFERVMSSMGNDWVDMIGMPVLPRFISVVDNPTISSVDGVPTIEALRVDDEGVPTRENTIVERGILRTLLTTRVPVPGIEKTTGSRRGAGPAPSQVIVTAHVTQPPAELRRRLLDLATGQGYEYAVVVRRLANPRNLAISDPMMMMSFASAPDGPDGPRMQALAAFKVYPDGREEQMRAAEISGVTATTFRTILAASQARTVYSAPFVPRGSIGSAGSGTVTYVVPSLLFANVTLRRPRGGNPKLPIVAAP